MVGAFVTELIDGLLSVAGSAPDDRVRRHVDAVREAVRPHPHTVLHAADGTLFTGLVVVEESVPIVMLCARRRDPHRAHRPHWSDTEPSMLEDGFEY